MTLLGRPAAAHRREIAGYLLDDYGRDRSRGQALRVQLQERFPECPEETIEEGVQSACGSFLEEADGISDPAVAYVWIRTVAYRAVIRELGLRRRATPLVPTEGVIGEAVEEGPGPVEELIELETATELELLVHEVAASLSGQRRQILSLWAVGRRRSEIAAELGIGERAVKRGLEQIMREARDRLAAQAGGGCEEEESLVLRFACGLAGAGEAVRARIHIERCGRCSEFAGQLEGWREKVGAVLPPVAIEVAHPGLVGRVVGRADDAISSARRHVLGGATQVKQQAVAAGYTRTPDPTPLAGVRPTAVAAVVAGCLAIGGGATYCAQQGVDPLGAAKNLIAGTQEEAKEEPPAPPAQKPETPVPPVEAPVETPVVAPVYEPPAEEPSVTEAAATHEEQAASAEKAPKEPEPQPEPAPEPEPVTPPAEQSFEPASPDYPATESSTSSSSSSGSGTATSEAPKATAVPANEAPQFGGP